MIEQSLKPCATCKWYKSEKWGVYCNNPKLGYDGVTGNIVKKLCLESRRYYYCNNGEWWEPKMTLFMMLMNISSGHF